MRMILRWVDKEEGRTKFEYFGGFASSKEKAIGEYYDWVVSTYNSGKEYRVERLIDSTDLERYKSERLTESLYAQEYIKEDLEKLFRRFCKDEITRKCFEEVHSLLSSDLARHLARIVNLYEYFCDIEYEDGLNNFQRGKLKDLGLIKS